MSLNVTRVLYNHWKKRKDISSHAKKCISRLIPLYTLGENRERVVAFSFSQKGFKLSPHSLAFFSFFFRL